MSCAAMENDRKKGRWTDRRTDRQIDGWTIGREAFQRETNQGDGSIISH